MLTWSRSHTLHPYMLYSYTESKQKHDFSLSTNMPFHLPTKQRPHVFKISFTSPYKSGKETWAICYERERELEKMSWKRVWKKREISVKRKCWAKQRGWASKIAHDLKHLDLERESLRSQPSTHIHKFALLILVCMLFSSMDPCFNFYNTNILSMPFKFSNLKLHISHSCKALKQTKILARTYTQIILSDLREPYEE
jgi:hypothetical protein